MHKGEDDDGWSAAGDALQRVEVGRSCSTSTSGRWASRCLSVYHGRSWRSSSSSTMLRARTSSAPDCNSAYLHPSLSTPPQLLLQVSEHASKEVLNVTNIVGPFLPRDRACTMTLTKTLLPTDADSRSCLYHDPYQDSSSHRC